MKSKFIETGKIVNIHGLRGEVKVMPWSDSPDFICQFDVIHVLKLKKPYVVEYARVHKNSVLIKFKGIDTPEAANNMRSDIIYLRREDIKLEEGVYFVSDILGMTVKDSSDGRVYGKIIDVHKTGANDVYEIEKDGKSYLIPAIPDVIVSIDIENSVMVISPLEGLFNEN